MRKRRTKIRSAAPARPSAPAVELAAEPAVAGALTPQEHGAALDQAIGFFRARDPEGWDELALCPLRHGVETILERLRVMR